MWRNRLDSRGCFGSIRRIVSEFSSPSDVSRPYQLSEMVREVLERRAAEASAVASVSRSSSGTLPSRIIPVEIGSLEEISDEEEIEVATSAEVVLSTVPEIVSGVAASSNICPEEKASRDAVIERDEYRGAEIKPGGSGRVELRSPEVVPASSREFSYQDVRNKNSSLEKLGEVNPVSSISSLEDFQRPRSIRKKLSVIRSGRMFGGLDRIPTDPELDPPFGACFNCWKDHHQLADCQAPVQPFCRNCGRWGVTLTECPRCYRVHRRDMIRNYGEKAYLDYRRRRAQALQQRHVKVEKANAVLELSREERVLVSPPPAKVTPRKVESDALVSGVFSSTSRTNDSQQAVFSAASRNLVEELRDLEKLLEGFPPEMIKEAKMSLLRERK